jgi:V/A-type H+-transporting ATPase subunit I
MIVKMKKLTLLCTPAQQKQTLNKLRELKVVHIEHVQAPEGTELETARNHQIYVQRAKEVLSAHPEADPTGKDADQLVDTVWELIHREKELKETLQSLEHEEIRITPFGNFDPREVQKLIDGGLFIKLYELPVKDTPEAPEGVALTEISRGKTTLYTLAVSRAEFSIPAHEARLPDQSLSFIQSHIEKTKAALVETEVEFQQYAGDRALVEQIAGDASDRVNFLEVESGMGSESSIIYLKGFYPIDRESDLKAAAQDNGWGYQLEEVTDEDDAPTLLRNPKWVSPVKAVFGLIGVIPGYKELDVSALFMIFLSIFFAFLIGDAGYGLLFIGLTLFGKMKTKGNEAAQPGLNLLLLMSSFCVIFGALTGNYFGIPIEALPAPLRGLTSDYMTGKTGEGWNADLAASHIMFICFTIGTLHLTLAHGWNLIRKINSWSALTDLGWLCCTWSLFSVVLNMVLYIVLPSWVATVQLPLLGTGIGLIVLSLVLTKSYFGLVTLLLDVINNFVDIISYVRLYAVGAASLAIAQAFNGMAMDIGFSGLGSIGAALILFAGHGLNIILGAMGVMVHGIRLNTLEFSGHAGVEWAGIHFNPFRKNTDNL